ncbi:ECF transporter S component [Candidatus Bathyarchaeota archaeon]|nr:ECF transporter S component [Candidatus Bathyarchaeota archaeon]
MPTERSPSDSINTVEEKLIGLPSVMPGLQPTLPIQSSGAFKTESLKFSKQVSPRSRALSIALIAISAALYAAAIAVTAPIPTPWGVGHFRPGVVVPAFFAVVCGPMIGGAGAALGCFIGDYALSLFGLTDPLLSLIAGVPGNFVGFYMLGWFTSRYKSWLAFQVGSLISLIVGNLIAASGVVAYLTFIIPIWAPWPQDVKIATVLGFTLFWFSTMLPFVVPLVPILVRRVSKYSHGPLRNPGLTWGKPKDFAYVSLCITACLLLLYAAVILTPFGDFLFIRVAEPQHIFWIKTLILIAAAIMLLFGMVVSLFLSHREKKGID